MDCGSAISHHEYVFGVGKQHLEIVHGLERQRVLVAESRGRNPVPSYHFEYERSDCRVDHILGHAGLFKSHRFLFRLVPVVTHLQDSRHHSSLLSAPVTEIRLSTIHSTPSRAYIKNALLTLKNFIVKYYNTRCFRSFSLFLDLKFNFMI